jgi:hypothetical protein
LNEALGRHTSANRTLVNPPYVTAMGLNLRAAEQSALGAIP